MMLSRGTRFGPYEVLAPLGAGGMGEVWSARDTRLGREVAIKVLPAEVASDPSRLKRFEKEARAASALNHPNIVTIYDIGQTDSLSYIAMEQVEGRTLRELLLTAALPIKKTLQISVQIADGLAKAHDAGIVHRDLKPENVMVTKDGLVKILDFGLAKLTQTGSGSDKGSQLPTETGTSPGVLLGTVGYMSPEQALGHPADFRSDQFAFGSILYEMTTGKRAFQKKTAIDTLAAILNEEPEPVGEINSQAPGPLCWIVERCLSKDCEDRYASTKDLAKELATIRDHLSESGVAAAGVRVPKRRRGSIVWPVVAVVAMAVAGVSLLRSRPLTPNLRSMRFSISPPPNVEYWGDFALSPDGSQLAFTAAAHGEAPRIWVRPLAALDARVMPGTERADSIFWSPDGRAVGFFGAGKLWRADLSGGAAVPLCDVRPEVYYWGTWGAGGQILFASLQGDAIYRVSASGGTPSAIVKPDRARGETKVTWPWFLPDGKSFLYHLRREGSTGSLMFSPPDGPRKPVFSMLSRAEYVDPGYLVFVREGTLIAQRFDARSGAISSEPFSIADSVGYFLSIGSADFTTSRAGVLALQARAPPGQRMSWFDRTGQPVETLGQPGGYGQVAISPDGRRVLFNRAQPKTGTLDIWMFDLERGVETRVTSDPDSEFGGVWLPDGKSIVYSADRGAGPRVTLRELATGREQALLPDRPATSWVAAMQTTEDVTPDGAQLAYSHRTDRGDFDVELVSLSGDHKSSPLLHTPFSEEQVRFSADGRFIVFLSDESGRSEAYVASIGAVGEKIRISSGGAEFMRWNRNGHEIFYLSPDRHLVSVPVRASPSLSPGKPTTLFTLKEDAVWTSFDVSPDGQRFLAVVRQQVAPPPPLTVVLNWAADSHR